MSNNDFSDDGEAIFNLADISLTSAASKSAISDSTPIIDNKDREVAHLAQTEYENENHHLVLDLLESLGTNKAVSHNRLITQFGVDNDVDILLEGLITSEDLDLDQQVLVDYNRALVLAKYKQRYEEAIDLLEQRINVLSEQFGLVDDRLGVKMCHLLAILYIERRKDPNKALPLLQFVCEKSDQSSLPPSIQQLKAKCYLEMGSTKLAKRELKTVTEICFYFSLFVNFLFI